MSSSDSEQRDKRPDEVLASDQFKNHVLVPLPYFHLLVKSYYGVNKVQTQSPATEVQEMPPELRQMVLAKVYPETMVPRGFAAKKRQEQEDQGR